MSDTSALPVNVIKTGIWAAIRRILWATLAWPSVFYLRAPQFAHGGNVFHFNKLRL